MRDGGDHRAGRAAAAATATASASSRSYHMAEVAAYVAAGGVVPPGDSLDAASTIAAARRYNDGVVVGDDRGGGGGGGISSRRLLPIVDNHAARAFSPCPMLPPARLLSEWNMLSSLARSMAYQSAGSYCETAYVRTGGPFERIAEYRGGDGRRLPRGEAPFGPIECLGMIWGIANDARLPTTTTTAPAVSDGTSTVAPEKVFDAHLLQLLGVAVSPAMGAEEKGQKLSEMLMDIVIDVVSTASAMRFVLFGSLFAFLTPKLSSFVCVWFATPRRTNEGADRHQSLPATFLPSPILHRRVRGAQGPTRPRFRKRL